MAPLDSLTSKTCRSIWQNRHPKYLSTKVMVKDIFFIIDGNVRRSLTSHIQTTQDILYLLKDPDPSYLVLKFGNILPINN